MRRQQAAALLVLAIIASACGGSEDTSRAVATPTAPTTAGAKPEPSESPTAAAEPTPLEQPPTPLSDVLATSPDELGWHLPAGRWLTGVFAAPVEFTTSVDLILVRESLGAVWLRNPATPEHENSVVIAATGFVNSGEAGSPERPVPATPEAITAEIERNPVANLLRQGTVEGATGSIPWWDFEHVDPNNTTAFPCARGPRCISPATTIGGEQIIALLDEPTRVYVAGTDDVRVGVWITGDAAGHAALTEIADGIAASIRRSDTSLEASPSRSLAALGLRGSVIPAGEYVTRLGSTRIDLVLSEDVLETGVAQVERNVVAFEGAHGFVGFLTLTHLVDHDADPLVRALPTREWPVIDLSGADGGQFAQWLLTAATVEAVEPTEVGGARGTAYDIVLPDPTPSPSICQRACVPLILTENNTWVFFGDWANRVVHIPDAAVMLHLEARPGSTMEQLLADAAPILDGITFHPAD